MTGLRLMIRILHERMRDHMMGGRFDPTPLFAREGPYVSGGAGASGSAPLGAERRPMPRELDGVHREFDAATKAYFGPQPTPEAAFRRYLEWLGTGQFDPHVGLLTGPSREYLASLPVTPAYFDHVLTLYAGEEYRIAGRGDMAMLYFTSTPLVSPLFLRRDPEGWRMDIVEEVHSTREYAGGWATWGITIGGEAYSRFRDLLVEFNGGLVRVADGDNRPLPTPEVQRRREERERSHARALAGPSGT